MFTRCNMLRRRFYNCSMSVKLVLFKSFCLCFYNLASWNRFRIGLMNKFRSCYTKCAKLMFLGFTKHYRVTNTLLLSGLARFDTLMNKSAQSNLARGSRRDAVAHVHPIGPCGQWRAPNSPPSKVPLPVDRSPNPTTCQITGPV